MNLRKLCVKFKIVERKTQDNSYKGITDKFEFPSRQTVQSEKQNGIY